MFLKIVVSFFILRLLYFNVNVFFGVVMYNVEKKRNFYVINFKILLVFNYVMVMGCFCICFF